MDNIIVLSDSDESIGVAETLELNKKREIDGLSDSSFEFPEVNFHYEKPNQETKSPVKEDNFDSAFGSCETYDINSDTELDSRSSSFSKCSQNSAVDRILQKYSILKSAEKPKKKKTVKSTTTQKIVDVNKELLKAEKQKKKEEQAKEKALKAVASKNLKNLKPQECMKSIRVIIDQDIQKFPYFTDILTSLVESELTFDVNSQLIPGSISWKRQIEENYVDEKGEICTRKHLQEEDHVLIVWNWNEVVEKISNGTFTTSIASISSLLPRKRITLLIYGIIDYFAYHKSVRDKNVRDEVLNELGKEKPKKRYNKNDKIYEDSPKISKNDFEVSLTEIQILNNCSSRIILSSSELGSTICQFTKAIAEIPYKKEKNKGLEDKVSWYAAGDNRDTVKVDKDGNGLKRLWQQQLCQFNLSSLEISEAICQVYGSPLQLMEAYMKCTQVEGEMLLKDLPIRRAAGPVTTSRKIGPELSKKIYQMFTSENGETLLNND